MADVVYFLDDSAVLVFSMAGGRTGFIPLDPGWHVASSGDYDGDGRIDILMRNTNTSQVAIWLLNGPELIEVVPIFNLQETWEFRTGDFDGDGTDDLLVLAIQTPLLMSANASTRQLMISLVE